MPQIPTFFFSHSRQDREMRRSYLEKFFTDLDETLAQLAGVDLQVQQLGIIDREVFQGDDWDRDLSSRLGGSKVFVAIVTPLYFTRPNCGKELFAFLTRSRKLGIDSNGALTDVENILLIRWVMEEAYNLIPILHRVNDTPAHGGNDPDRAAAIRRYRKKGMAQCVDVEPYYGELLNLFAHRINTMPDLVLGCPFSFVTLENAFTYDWEQHFAAAGASTTAVAPTLPAVPAAPRALASIVGFYVTNRAFTADPGPPGFADQVIREPLTGTDPPSAMDPILASLVADVSAAALTERLAVLHAASTPAVPVSTEPLLSSLLALSNAGVLTFLIIDPAIWPSTASDRTASAIDEIIRAPDWSGAVLLPALGTSAPPLDVVALMAARRLPSRIFALPSASEDRVSAMSRVFIDIRGRVLRGSAVPVSDAEHVPLLRASVRPVDQRTR
jgi:hypothetical protein